MIAGETEALLAQQGYIDNQYDNFLFFGKKNKNADAGADNQTKAKKAKKPKKELSEEEKAARKEKRQETWKNISDQFKEGGTVSNILNLFGVGNNANSSSMPSDYEFGVAGQDSGNDKQGIPTAVWVVGGVVVLGLALFTYSQIQKKKDMQIAQTPQ